MVSKHINFVIRSTLQGYVFIWKCKFFTIFSCPVHMKIIQQPGSTPEQCENPASFLFTDENEAFWKPMTSENTDFSCKQLKNVGIWKQSCSKQKVNRRGNFWFIPFAINNLKDSPANSALIFFFWGGGCSPFLVDLQYGCNCTSPECKITCQDKKSAAVLETSWEHAKVSQKFRNIKLKLKFYVISPFHQMSLEAHFCQLSSPCFSHPSFECLLHKLQFNSLVIRFTLFLFVSNGYKNKN